MKIKILHILHALGVGGLENGVVNLVNHLDFEQFEHEICCVTQSGAMAQRLTRRVKIHEIGKGAGRTYLLPLRIAALIRKVHPDIVHTRNWGTIDGVIGARLAGVKNVVHGEHGREATDPNGANYRRQIFRRLLAPAISRFVTVSSDLEEWLVKDVGVLPSKVRQIINGVDTAKFFPAVNRREVKRKFGFTDSRVLVGIVGRLDAVKDHPTLIKAIHAQAQSIHLLIIGSGPMEENLRSLVAQLKIDSRVSFLGVRSDIPELMKAMDVFVLPSIAEGISNTILEAMSSGLPVVASRVGGNPELVIPGETGELFEAGKFEELAGILSTYCSDPALIELHGHQGRARVEEYFSLDVMVQKYAEMYRSLVAK